MEHRRNVHQKVHHGHSHDHWEDLHPDGTQRDRFLNMTAREVAALDERQKRVYEHVMMHEKHKGHETMHLEMFLILITTLFVAQIVLVQWRQRHFASYQKATLLGMWIVPVVICLWWEWYRFVFLSLVFSIGCFYIYRRASEKPVLGSTPRLVYRWFLLNHQISFVVGVVGYFLTMFTLLGFNFLFLIPTQTAMDFSLLLMFYGMYFGVLGRDLAEVVTDTLAVQLGYYHGKGMATRELASNVCAVCNLDIYKEDGQTLVERTFKLNCSHVFHEFCVRGWCIIGKKQTCPYCKEKVDLKRMFKNPWEKPHLLYGNLLDWVRYLVAWQPIILGIVQGMNWMLALE